MLKIPPNKRVSQDARKLAPITRKLKKTGTLRRNYSILKVEGSASILTNTTFHLNAWVFENLKPGDPLEDFKNDGYIESELKRYF